MRVLSGDVTGEIIGKISRSAFAKNGKFVESSSFYGFMDSHVHNVIRDEIGVESKHHARISKKKMMVLTESDNLIWSVTKIRADENPSTTKQHSNEPKKG